VAWTARVQRNSLRLHPAPETTARAFAGISANTIFNITRPDCDADRALPDDRADAGRRGSLAAKDRAAFGGTFPAWRPVRRSVVGVILIVGGLTYFPALALGPVVEHFSMNAGKLF
jgi:K+-transporting ATPase ATPase A chain